MNNTMRPSPVKIETQLASYKPPFNVYLAVTRILLAVPQRYLVGLEKILVRDTVNLTRRERLRRKRLSRKEKVILGTYYGGSGKSRPRIDLFVDRILEPWPRVLLWTPFFQDAVIGRVLSHEIGHHIHRHIRPEHRDSEAIAINWEKALLRPYLRKRYWYWWPLVLALKLLVKLARSVKKPADSSRPTLRAQGTLGRNL